MSPKDEDTAEPMIDYQTFLQTKAHFSEDSGFDPIAIPSCLYDFQRELVTWALKKGRAAIFADCGLGKTPMQLVWADNVARHAKKPVLILTPIAVGLQTIKEGEKFGIECARSLDGRVASHLTITNYERLHKFDPGDFAGVVCDESSILKNFDGKTRGAVTDFLRKIPYRLLCTATAAPNDYIEFGTSSEALGGLGYMDMLGMFFKNDENSLHPIHIGSKWRFKPHAERPFWRWMCSWARAIRKPSDLGYADGQFILPKLTISQHVVKASRPMDGYLFVIPANGLDEQRRERRHTIRERCERVASLVQTGEPAVIWCHLNHEGDLLEDLIPDAVQVSGADSDDAKEEKLDAFTRGQVRVMITKPKIAGFGLNWQHCRHVLMFPSHSFEQYYQSVRRCWRFGQTQPVTVDIVTTEGEADVMQNLQRKAAAAENMFTMIVKHMRDELAMWRQDICSTPVEVPPWVYSIKS
jgi:hypothetical protein